MTDHPAPPPEPPADPGPRWPRDSDQEAAEEHRANELDRLSAWVGEQRTRPLTDALKEHGLTEDERRGYPGPLVLPEWWADIRPPVNACPWCQRAVPASPCPECRAARIAHDEPPLWAWWAGLDAAARRVHIAATYRVDPWSGRRCRIEIDWLDVGPDGELTPGRLLYLGAAPRGIYWGALAAEG